MSFQRELGVNLAGVEVILGLFDRLADVHRRVGSLAEEIHDALEMCPRPNRTSPPRPRRLMVDDNRRPNPPDNDRLAPASPTADARIHGEPRRNWLRRIIGQGPEARRQLGEAVAALLGTALVALAAIGALLIWHLLRRGRIIRERLEPPKVVRLPELHDLAGGLHDDQDDVPPP